MNAYFNYASPASFGGISELAHVTRTSQSKTRDYLRSIDVYTKFKPARRRFPRRKFIAYHKFESFHADLADVRKYARFNKNYKYILVVVDVLSKYVFYVPIKNKKPDDILAAFVKVFRVAVPKHILVDRGTEFVNKKMDAFFAKHGVNRYHTYSETKASIAERQIRTLKEKLERIFHHRGSYRYIDILSQLQESYNHKKHTVTKIAPIDVNESNEMAIFQKLYGGKKRFSQIPKFRVGDSVRISVTKGPFTKGYVKNWSDEVFEVSKIRMTDPIIYYVQDIEGQEIRGSFYAEELNKIVKSNLFEVEKVLQKRRRKDGQMEYKVRWLGYGPQHDSWTSEIHRK